MNLSITTSSQIYQALRYGAWIVVSILINKSILSQTDVGIYEQLMMMGTYFSIFWISGIFSSLLVQYKTLENHDKKTYLFNHFLVYAIANIFFLLAFILIGNSISKVFLSDVLPHYKLMAVFFFMNNFSYFIEHIFILNQKAKALLYYAIFNFILQISCLIYVLVFHPSLEYVFYAAILFGSIKLFIVFILIYQESIFKIDKKHLVDVLTFSTPLVLSFILTSSIEYIDKIIISKFYSHETFTQYIYGAKEFALAIILSKGLMMSALPLLTENREAGLVLIKEKTRTYVRYMSIIGIFMIFISYYLFPILLNKNLTETWKISNTFMLMIVPRMILNFSIVNATGKNRIIIVSSLIEIFFNIFFSLILIKEFGIVGIAWACFLSLYIEKIFYTFYCKYKLNISIDSYIHVKEFIFWQILLLISYFAANAIFSN